MEAECADRNERAESSIDDALARAEPVIEALPPHMDGLLVSSYGGQGSSMLNAEKRPEAELTDTQASLAREPAPRDQEQEWLRELHRSVLAAFDEQLKRALIRRGAAPEVLAGPELCVSLSDISLIDWIQAIQLFAKHAIITVIHDDTESRLWCSGGALVDAESGRLRGEAALYRIVSIERGQVVTELREEPRPRTIRASTPGLLLEAARRKDEAAMLRARLGDLGRRFQGPPTGRWPRLDARESATLELFTRPRRLADALAESTLGELETLSALDDLIRSGRLSEAPPAVLEPAPPSAPSSDDGLRRLDSVAPLARSRPPEPAPASNGRGWGATVVAALAVALAAWLGARGAAWSSASARAESSAAASAAGGVSRDPETYPVALRTIPAGAEIEIDGRPVGRGEWRGRFARDGAIHELRATAPGHVPLRVLFIDTAPPLDLHLEPLERAEPPVGVAALEASVARSELAKAARSASSFARNASASRASAAAADEASVADAEKPPDVDAEPDARARPGRGKSLAASRAARRAAAASARSASSESADEAEAAPPPASRGKRKPYVQLIEGDPERAAGLTP